MSVGFTFGIQLIGVGACVRSGVLVGRHAVTAGLLGPLDPDAVVVSVEGLPPQRLPGQGRAVSGYGVGQGLGETYSLLALKASLTRRRRSRSDPVGKSISKNHGGWILRHPRSLTFIDSEVSSQVHPVAADPCSHIFPGTPGKSGDSVPVVALGVVGVLLPCVVGGVLIVKLGAGSETLLAILVDFHVVREA